MIFVRSTFLKHLKALNFSDEFVEIATIENMISLRSGIPMNFLSLFYNGKRIYSCQRVPQDSTVDVCFSLTGGKGGFGSMLRAIGAQIEKTTNREACRDLSGRRLRDINEEQRLKRWLAKKAEREEEQLKRRKAKLERLKQTPKHKFQDPEYDKEISELSGRIDNALSQGLRKASKASASKAEGSCEPPLKKKRRWLDDEISSDSEEDSQGDLHQSLGESSKSGQASSSDSVDCDDLQSAAIGTSSDQTDVDHVQLKSPTKSKNEKPATGEESQKAKPTTSEEPQTENFVTGDESQNEKPASAETHPGDQALPCVRDGEDEQTKKIPHLTSDPEISVQLESKEIEESFDLLQFQTSSELEGLGLEKLKTVLMDMGLKCGGTLTQRAQRLWSVRGIDPNDYPQSLRAKKKS